MKLQTDVIPKPTNPGPDLPAGMKQRLEDLLYGLRGDATAYRRSVDDCNSEILRSDGQPSKRATEETARLCYEGGYRLLNSRAEELEGLMREAGMEVDS